MDVPTSARTHLLEQDGVARIASVRSARNRALREICVKLASWLLAGLRAGGLRRELFALSNQQLTDAGIDLAQAGRGKAAAARLDPNLEGSR